MLKPIPQSVSRLQRKRARFLEARAVRRTVLARDHYRCRSCGAADHVDAHHLKFRSAGGATIEPNMVALCRCCHDLVHAYRLTVIGENANRRLRFVKVT